MDKCNLIVNYLPPDVNDAHLKALFTQYGNVVHSKVVKEKITGKSSCYGFVLFEKEAEAAVALDAINGMEIGGKKLKVSVARPRKKSCVSNTKLFITGLPLFYRESDVKQLFSQYGDVVSVRLLTHSSTGNSKGTAFLEYNESSECEKATSALHNTKLAGSQSVLAVVRTNPNHYEMKKLGKVKSDSRSQQDKTEPTSECPVAASAPSSTLTVETRGSGSLHSTTSPHVITSPRHGQQSLTVFPVVSPIPSLGPSIFWNETTPSVAAPVAADVTNLRYTLKIWDLPMYANIGHLYHIFSPYGIVISATIDIAVSANGFLAGYVCSGTGFVEMIGSSLCKDAALVTLNSAIVFEGWNPLRVAIVC